MDRRASDTSAGDRCFVRWLSLVLVIVSSIGAMIVLIDPVITFVQTSGTTIKIGGEGFSDQLKGAVVSLILVAGFASVITYWLGASNQGQRAQESVSTIATQAAPLQAAAVAAARAPVPDTPTPENGALQAGTVNVETGTTNITTGETKP